MTKKLDKIYNTIPNNNTTSTKPATTIVVSEVSVLTNKQPPKNRAIQTSFVGVCQYIIHNNTDHLGSLFKKWWLWDFGLLFAAVP